MSSEQVADKTMCVIGDTHGHLQLGLCVAARWQRELGVAFDAVFLCGDVGTFTSEGQLDSTTRRHGKDNPCELEFLYQWSVDPQPGWLAKIFEPTTDGGLGLLCPVIMVHGNHEGFAHLETLVASPIPTEAVEIARLPTVDPGCLISYLPSGWRCRTQSGLVVAGVGGIERGQRLADYHEMAYIDQDAVAHLLGQAQADVLITHQGPSGLQGEMGSETLQLLLEEGSARAWFHGHASPHPDIRRFGRGEATLVVPLKDIAFASKGLDGDDPGEDGWAVLYGDGADVRRERPGFWREYRKRKWKAVDERRLVCPDLARWAEPGAAADGGSRPGF
jgi:predicted phosphodiesterase